MQQQVRTGDQSLVREINLSTVLRWLREESPLSRARLADRTGLNKTTVSSLAAELAERGLIHDVGVDATGLGRPSTLLELNPHAGCILGVELGVDFVSVLLTDFVGGVLWRRRCETDPSAAQGEIIALALGVVDEASAVGRERGARLLGCGLVLPGLVDVDRGVLVLSPNLQWRDVPLRHIFHERAGVPIWVDNDANAAALGEHLFGVARQAHNFIFLMAGVGLGGGLFLGGELYRGAGGFAGEIGHTSLTTDRSRPCRCGNKGCWETIANQYSLIERVRARLEVRRASAIRRLLAEENAPLSVALIARAAEAGDAEALEALAETGAAIGLGAANLINVFNPEMVVLGGSMSVAGRYLLPAMVRVIEERAMAEVRLQTRVVSSAFGPDASAMGAVALVVKAILTEPSRVERVREG